MNIWKHTAPEHVTCCAQCPLAAAESGCCDSAVGANQPRRGRLGSVRAPLVHVLGWGSWTLVVLSLRIWKDREGAAGRLTGAKGEQQSLRNLFI